MKTITLTDEQVRALYDALRTSRNEFEIEAATETDPDTLKEFRRRIDMLNDVVRLIIVAARKEDNQCKQKQ